MADTDNEAKGGLFSTEVPGVLSGSYEFIGKAVATLEENIEATRTEVQAALNASQSAQSAAEDAEDAVQAIETNVQNIETNITNIQTNVNTLNTSSNNAADDAEKLAINAEDAGFTLSDGSTTGYSALHYNAKAQDAKTAAETAQTASEAAQDAAELALDTFTDLFLGKKTADPTLDNDGDALQDGALYFNTTDNVLKFYDLGNTTWHQTTPTTAQQTNIDSAVANATNINAVVANETNIDKVAAIDTDVTAVATIDSDVTAVANNNANVTTVAGINANVTTVANISTDVTAVANISSDIQDVQDKLTEIQTAADDLNEATSEIETVANAITNVDNVGNNIANVNTVATDIANVNTVATNLTDVNAFADTYFIAATAPSGATQGDLWFDTSSNTMKVYSGSLWQNAGSSVNGTEDRFKYVATSGQTVFSGTDSYGGTLAYDSGFIDVYLNGVHLDPSDYTATDGTTITLNSGAALNDELYIVAFGTFVLADHYTKTQVDSFINGVIADVVDDTTPQLGGNLDLNSSDITGTGNINITGNITGTTLYGDGSNLTGIDALPSQSGQSGNYLTTDGSAASWAALDTDANTTTKALYEMANSISTNYSITSGNNAMSAGPISIDSGISVTIPTGSVWTIV